jgi:hypothetical protein
MEFLPPPKGEVAEITEDELFRSATPAKFNIITKHARLTFSLSSGKLLEPSR